MPDEGPYDVDLTGGRYRLDVVFLGVGEELDLFEDEEILHVEKEEGGLSLWILEEREKRAFLAQSEVDSDDE